MAWDEDKKAKAVKMYLDAEPTPENSIEIVKDIAEELEESPNGVRMILSKAEVYVKKDATATPKKDGGTKTAGTRTSKADAFKGLTDVLSAAGVEADMEIIEKLTGKQAVYFTEVLKKLV